MGTKERPKRKRAPAPETFSPSDLVSESLQYATEPAKRQMMAPPMKQPSPSALTVMQQTSRPTRATAAKTRWAIHHQYYDQEIDELLGTAIGDQFEHISTGKDGQHEGNEKTGCPSDRPIVTKTGNYFAMRLQGDRLFYHRKADNHVLLSAPRAFPYIPTPSL
ncbi:hypothetical protein BKA81DRAFT_359885 [Phyllosticta paracitricarpa]